MVLLCSYIYFFNHSFVHRFIDTFLVIIIFIIFVISFIPLTDEKSLVALSDIISNLPVLHTTALLCGYNCNHISSAAINQRNGRVQCSQNVGSGLPCGVSSRDAQTGRLFFKCWLRTWRLLYSRWVSSSEAVCSCQWFRFNCCVGMSNFKNMMFQC